MKNSPTAYRREDINNMGEIQLYKLFFALSEHKRAIEKGFVTLKRYKKAKREIGKANKRLTLIRSSVLRRDLSIYLGGQQ